MKPKKIFGQNFKAWRDSKGVTNYKIEKITGYSRGNLSNIESGALEPSDDLLELLAGVEELGIPLNLLKIWKMVDKYPEVLQSFFEKPTDIGSFSELFLLLKKLLQKEPTLQEMADIIGAAPIAIEPMYMEYVNEALGKNVVYGEAHLKGTKTPPVKTVLLPMFGATVPAGFPNSGDEWVNGYFELPESMIAHPKDSFIIQTRGDSMLQAGILDGDSLIVDRAVEPKDKDIVVACLDGEFTVKRLRKKRGKIYLEPANDAYEAIDATGRIDCCYKVVGSYRQF